MHRKKNLDLEAVGDYLSSPEQQNKEVLKHFTQEIDLSGQSFTDGLRGFLKTFKLPGEAQKIDRLVESFSDAYCRQNPDGQIANKEAAYVLAFATIMLATDLHNPSIEPGKKMTLQQFKNNTRGVNNGGDFDSALLEQIYNNIKKEKFELNFVKVNPGYELSPTALKTDKTFEKLDLLLKSSKSDNSSVQKVFPDIGSNVTAEVTKTKSFLSKLTGYEGTITLTDESTRAKVTVQVYKPNVFSQYLFGDKPKTIIQPIAEKGSKASLDLAAKVAAGFSSPLSSIKATYDYEKTDMHKSYETHKNNNIQKLTNVISEGVRKYTTTERAVVTPNKKPQSKGVVIHD